MSDMGSDPQAEASGSDPTSPDRESQQWAMFAHLSALTGFFIPFGNIIGPIVIWQLKKEMPFVADQGKEALNFQTSPAPGRRGFARIVHDGN